MVKIESYADYKQFCQTPLYRWSSRIYFAGVVVSVVGGQIATFVTRNRLENHVCFVIGAIMWLPWLSLQLWILHKARQSHQQVKLEQTIRKVILEIIDPDKYKRLTAIKEVKDIYKNDFSQTKRRSAKSTRRARGEQLSADESTALPAWRKLYDLLWRRVYLASRPRDRQGRAN